MRVVTWVRRVARVAAWAATLLALAALTVGLVVPRLAGGSAYTVLTGSMRPGLPPGTLVVVRPVETGELRTGDVVTYQLRSDEPAVVTHRVVAVGVDGAGELRLTTRGDANDVADPVAVRPEQVRGRLWYAVPHLGHVGRLLSGEQRRLAGLVLAGLLLSSAASAYARVVREHRAASSRRTPVAAGRHRAADAHPRERADA
ncbi:signal peptidase I [Nocardioides kribbensis]|uniref:signal peptidase I n=1 Tax=Nocardioides kribbensis TaxID=305517 RepID=UPI0032DBA5AB